MSICYWEYDFVNFFFCKFLFNLICFLKFWLNGEYFVDLFIFGFLENYFEKCFILGGMEYFFELLFEVYLKIIVVIFFNKVCFID